VLEKDVDVDDADADLADGVAQRSAEAGVEWDDVVVVAQLPPASKSGGSQKSWKRTNVVAIA
jgi:phenylacetate-CoA ligase